MVQLALACWTVGNEQGEQWLGWGLQEWQADFSTKTAQAKARIALEGLDEALIYEVHCAAVRTLHVHPAHIECRWLCCYGVAKVPEGKL